MAEARRDRPRSVPKSPPAIVNAVTEPYHFGRQNYVLPVPSGFSVRVFKAPTLSASARQCSNAGQQLSTVTARGDIDYKPSSHRDPRSSGPPARDTPRKLVKPPPASHVHSQEDRDREGERDRGYRDTRRFGFIHPGPVPDTYIYERSIASSKSDPYHDYYYPPSSDSSVSEIDSIFSLTSSASSSNSSVDDDCPPRGMHHAARQTPERRPSHHHGGQRSGTPFSVAYHTCPTCSEMSNSPPRSASRADSAVHASRPLPTPPVSARVRKDSLVLAGERSVPPLAPGTRPRLPQLRIGDRPAYPPQADAPQSAWSTAETGYLSSSPPPLTRSSSLKSSGSAGSSSHGSVPPPPGLNVHWEYGQTIDITSDPPYRQPHRRNSDGDQGHIMPPRPRRASTVPAPRSVRWCEDLVCPSPILPSQRRKGWFNRRGCVSSHPFHLSSPFSFYEHEPLTDRFAFADV